MFISVRYLIDRARHPRSRADELRRLRTQLDSARDEAGETERAIAVRLRDLREQMSSAQGAVDACGSCTTGHPLPASRWSGGHCCSTGTFAVFTDEEIAALAAAGTRPRDLAPPREDHAGCAFRGSTGCSLSAAHRPTVCSRYLCRDLRAELHARGDIDPLVELVDRMSDEYEAFLRARAARQDADELAEIERAFSAE